MPKPKTRAKRQVGRSKSPLARYRGIGTPGIGSDRTAINRWIRQMRGR